MEKVIMLEIRAQIRQTKLLFAKACKIKKKKLTEQVNMKTLYSCATILWSYWGPFLSLEAAILLASTNNRDLWPVPIFQHVQSVRSTVLSQSDSSNLKISPLIADFRYWERQEVSILGADQKDRSLWERECLRPVLVKFYRSGEETAFERHGSRVVIDKEQKQLLLSRETINPRTYKQTPTPPCYTGIRIRIRNHPPLAFSSF